MDSAADDHDQGDNDYVVTADMLIHEDIDDERTLAEEEDNGSEGGDYENELEELQKEQDMPLEQLLSYYGVRDDDKMGVAEEKVDIVKDSSPVHVTPDLLLPPGLMEDIPPQPQPSAVSTNKTITGKRKGPWFRPRANPEALARLRPVPERRSMKLCNEDGQRIVDSTFNNWLTNNESDDLSSECSDDWRKEIKVGRDYQASVLPTATCARYPEANDDMLLWKPSSIDEDDVQNYTFKINKIILQDRDGLPCGSCDRDNEHALYTLQSCDYRTGKAEKMFSQEITNKFETSSWTEEECEIFESGLKSHGKDFYLIQKQVPARTVKELIEFYYLWKKTERYDVFVVRCGKIGKKKFILRPGYLSDFMNDYLEPSTSSYPDLHYGTTTLCTEIKKDKYITAHSIDDRLSHKEIATKATS